MRSGEKNLPIGFDRTLKLPTTSEKSEKKNYKYIYIIYVQKIYV